RLEAALQGRDIESSAQPPCRGHVVSALGRQQPVEKPQPLLRKRQGQITTTGYRRNGGGRSRLTPAERLVHFFRERRYGRRLEEAAQRQFNLQEPGETRDHLGCE